MQKNNDDFIHHKLISIKIMKLAIKEDKTIGDKTMLRKYVVDIKDNEISAKA